MSQDPVLPGNPDPVPAGPTPVDPIAEPTPDPRNPEHPDHEHEGDPS